MGIEDAGFNPQKAPEKTPQGLGEGDENKDEVGEAEIKTGEETKLMPKGKEKLENRKEKLEAKKEKLETKEEKFGAKIEEKKEILEGKLEGINHLLEIQEEKVNQEKEDLPEEKKKIFESLVGKAKENLKKVSIAVLKFLTEHPTGVLVSTAGAGIADTLYEAYKVEVLGVEPGIEGLMPFVAIAAMVGFTLSLSKLEEKLEELERE